MKNYTEKSLKASNGITLIALVITIIVLLILAGISISMLSGNNGVLQRATTAKENTERVEIVENAKMDVLSEITENKGNDITEQQFISVLNKYFNNEDVPNSLPNDLNTLEMRTKNNKYKIYASEIYNGTIAKLEPGLYDANNNKIKSFDELVDLRAINLQSNNAIYGSSHLDQYENGVKLIIDNKVTKLTYGAFSGSTKLQEVVIGDGVTEISSGAFQDCTNLKNVIIGKNVKTISYSAFANCVSITDLDIPDNVEGNLSRRNRWKLKPI